MDTKQDQEPRAKSKPQPQATSREKRSRKESHATTAGFMATSKEATSNIYIGLPRRGKRAQKTPKPKYHQALGSRINSSEVPMCIEAYFFFEGPAEILSPSVPPEDLRPRAKNRFALIWKCRRTAVSLHCARLFRTTDVCSSLVLLQQEGLHGIVTRWHRRVRGSN